MQMRKNNVFVASARVGQPALITRKDSPRAAQGTTSSGWYIGDAFILGEISEIE